MSISKRNIVRFLILTVILIFIIVALFIGINNIGKLHLEKIPIIRTCVLGITKSMYVLGTECPTPITWDTLDKTPDGYPDDYFWFNYLNDYTRLQLKQYMKENNLYILPKNYSLENSNDIDTVLKILEFGKTDAMND